MKKILLLMPLLICTINVAQTRKTIMGKVVCKDAPVSAEIVNITTKQMATTDVDGKFSIIIKVSDVLVFIADGYEYYRLELKADDIKKNDLLISLTKKAIRLKEVVISQNNNAPISENTQKYVDMQYTDDKYSHVKNKYIYDGTIENGMDFMRMGKEIIKLFKKKKGYDKKKVKEIDFKEFAISTFNQNFFNNTLQLKEEQIPLFLEFCANDPKSKLIVDETNIMGVMDFFVTKNLEFKKTISSQ